MNKRAVITGGAGFIGSHAVEEFLGSGYEVVVIDNLRTGSLDNTRDFADRITFMEGDIRDGNLLSSIFRKGDIVIHLAAFVSVPESVADPVEAHDINVNGAHAVYVAARDAGASRVVTASSASVYGEPVAVPISEGHQLVPMSPYALHKSVNEQYGRLYSVLYGTRHVALRFFNVYGPRQSATGGYATVIPAFASKIRRGEPAVINGDGSSVRDFVYVKDVARALRMAAEHDMDGTFDAFNVATGVPVTISQLWNALCQVLGKDVKPEYGPARAGDVHVSLADVSRAREKLGFEAQTSLVEGLRNLL